MINNGFQMASTCDACGGQGTTIPHSGQCNTCGGAGKVRVKKAVQVTIPAGMYLKPPVILAVLNLLQVLRTAWQSESLTLAMLPFLDQDLSATFWLGST